MIGKKGIGEQGNRGNVPLSRAFRCPSGALFFSPFRNKRKGERAHTPSPLSHFPVTRNAYAGAGLPPVIGGRIGLSGFGVGSFNCGRSSSLPEPEAAGFSSIAKTPTISPILT